MFFLLSLDIASLRQGLSLNLNLAFSARVAASVGSSCFCLAWSQNSVFMLVKPTLHKL